MDECMCVSNGTFICLMAFYNGAVVRNGVGAASVHFSITLNEWNVCLMLNHLRGSTKRSKPLSSWHPLTGSL